MKIFLKGFFKSVTIIPSILLQLSTYKFRTVDPTVIAHTPGKPTVRTTVESECDLALTKYQLNAEI
jgi:hypothetical protein